MEKKLFYAAILIALLSVTDGQTLKAQHNNATDTTFHPHGTPIVTLFANTYVTASDATTYGFALDRAYLGYGYEFIKGLSAKVVFDIGKSSDVSDLQRLVYVKNAFVQWQYVGLTLKAGLIGLNQFETQEKLWGHRYLYKSFSDEYKFGNSADLGISAAYRFASWFSADVEIVNGEGYKKLQNDNHWLYAAGLTFNPIKSFTLRIYGDFTRPNQELNNGKTKENLSLFAGWKGKKISIGFENNYLFNSKYFSDHHQMGFSAYSTVKIGKCWEIFGRWDYLTSNRNWNKNEDGNLALLGCQYSPVKHIKISPNIRLWIPANSQETPTLGGYLNFEIKL